jgi:putative hydrolase of the HAD superfamily
MTGTAPENSLYVGDTWANDVVGALAAGWKVCWYNPRGRQPGGDHTPSYIFTNYKEFSELPLV